MEKNILLMRKINNQDLDNWSEIDLDDWTTIDLDDWKLPKLDWTIKDLKLFNVR